MKKKTLLISVFAITMLLAGCSGSNDNESKNNSDSRTESSSAVTENSGVSADSSDNTSSEASKNSSSETSTNSSNEPSGNSSSEPSANSSSEPNANSSIKPSADPGNEPSARPAVSGTDLEVCFGDSGSPFMLHLYDNPTAKAIARHVGTADWRLPIYHFDDYDNWEVMQYYDIPSRYEIPSDPETVTSEKAGEVYYSEPNRVVLFYGDADVTGEYTRVGYFDFTEEFKQAVENNPVLEGWGNKIVLIKK